MKFLFYSLVLCASGYLAYTQSHGVQDFADDLSGGKAADVVEQAEDVSGQMLWTAQEQIERWRSSQARVTELQQRVAELEGELREASAAAHEAAKSRPRAEQDYVPYIPARDLTEAKVSSVDPDQLMALIERMEMKAAGY
jgi:hypothetical protein